MLRTWDSQFWARGVDKSRIRRVRATLSKQHARFGGHGSFRRLRTLFLLLPRLQTKTGGTQKPPTAKPRAYWQPFFRA